MKSRFSANPMWALATLLLAVAGCAGTSAPPEARVSQLAAGARAG